MGRYRSRRDIADIFASGEFVEASVHKWAAIEDNDRLLVQGRHIPEGSIGLALLSIPVAFVASFGINLIVALRRSFVARYRGKDIYEVSMPDR